MLQICRLRLQVYPLQSRRHWSVANDKDRQENRPCDRLTIISSAAPAAAPARTISSIRTMAGCRPRRSEEHTSELQSLMRISYAVFCLKKKRKETRNKNKQKQRKHKRDTKQNKKKVKQVLKIR